MNRRNVVFRLGMLFLVFALAGSLAAAESPDRTVARAVASDEAPEGVKPTALVGPQYEDYQWMVKFVCGFMPSSGDGLEPVVPGRYATAINVAGSAWMATMSYRRVWLDYTPGSPKPANLPFRKAWVHFNSVLEIDCQDIRSMLRSDPGTFLKGVVHLGASRELPVMAVYTSQTNVSGSGAAPTAGAGVSVDVEYVEPFFSPAP